MNRLVSLVIAVTLALVVTGTAPHRFLWVGTTVWGEAEVTPDSM